MRNKKSFRRFLFDKKKIVTKIEMWITNNFGLVRRTIATGTYNVNPLCQYIYDLSSDVNENEF